MQLYQRLLGVSYEHLPPALRRFHAQCGGEAGLILEVQQPRGIVRAAIARALGLPAPTPRSPGLLRVEVRGDREIWTRFFPDRNLQSVQSIEGGALVERAGGVQFDLRVEADETGMRFTTLRCRFLGLPLPRMCAPSVAATVRGTATGWTADVTLALPYWGTILAYRATAVPA